MEIGLKTNETHQKQLQKKKETIYYILKTTYNVSHSTTMNIAHCVIQLLLD